MGAPESRGKQHTQGKFNTQTKTIVEKRTEVTKSVLKQYEDYFKLKTSDQKSATERNIM